MDESRELEPFNARVIFFLGVGDRSCGIGFLQMIYEGLSLGRWQPKVATYADLVENMDFLDCFSGAKILKTSHI